MHLAYTISLAWPTRMKYSIKVLSFVALCMIISGTIVPEVSAFATSGKTTYALTGYVRSSITESGISNVTVEFYAGSSWIATVSTSSNGYFSSTYESIFPVTSFRAVASKSGFNSTTVTKPAIDSQVDFGTICLAPIVRFNVSGSVRDAHNASLYLAHVSVTLYISSGSVGSTSTDSNGNFTFAFDTSDSVTYLRAAFARAYYVSNQLEIDNSGPSYLMDDVELVRSAENTVLASCQFAYSSVVYNSLWTPDNPGVCSTGCVNQKYAYVMEGKGVLGMNGYVRGDIDLGNWTGMGDLTLTVRIRAESDYLGNLSVTNFAVGIASWGTPHKMIWSENESFRFTRDTGFLVERYRIPADRLSYARETFDFYWGYRDLWNASWNQRVELDYFTISGNRVPATHIRLAFGAYTTGVRETTYDYQNLGYDSDLVGISTSNSVSIDELGMTYENSAFIDSVIAIVMDPDQELGVLSGSFCSVDRVEITMSIQGYGGSFSTSRGDAVINVPPAITRYSPIENNSYTLDRALGALSVTGLWSGNAIFDRGSLLYIYDQKVDPGDNSFAVRSGPGQYNVTFDFANYEGIAIGGSSTAFKMGVPAEATFAPDEVYNITISYQVTLKTVKWFKSFLYGHTYYFQTIRDVKLPQHTDVFSCIYFPSAWRSGEVHLVHLGGGMTLKAGKNTAIYPTAWGDGWKFVVGPNVHVSSSTDIQAIDVAYWGYVVLYQHFLPPFRMYVSSLDIHLTKWAAYYSFVGVDTLGPLGFITSEIDVA